MEKVIVNRKQRFSATNYIFNNNLNFISLYSPLTADG